MKKVALIGSVVALLALSACSSKTQGSVVPSEEGTAPVVASGSTESTAAPVVETGSTETAPAADEAEAPTDAEAPAAQ